MKNLTLVLLLCLSYSVLKAQTFEFNPEPDSINLVEFQFKRGLFEDGPSESLSSGLSTLKFKQSLSTKFNLQAALSYFNFSFDFGSESGLMNSYVGGQYLLNNTADGNSSIDMGLYLPTGSDELQLALYYDGLNLGYYVPLDIGFDIHYRANRQLNKNVRLDYQLGFDVFKFDDFITDEIESLFKYGIAILYKADSRFFVRSEFLGSYIVTEEGSFGEANLSTLSLGLGYDAEHIAPYIYFKAYLDDELRQVIDGLVGFGVRYKY